MSSGEPSTPRKGGRGAQDPTTPTREEKGKGKADPFRVEGLREELPQTPTTQRGQIFFGLNIDDRPPFVNLPEFLDTYKHYKERSEKYEEQLKKYRRRGRDTLSHEEMEDLQDSQKGYKIMQDSIVRNELAHMQDVRYLKKREMSDAEHEQLNRRTKLFDESLEKLSAADKSKEKDIGEKKESKEQEDEEREKQSQQQSLELVIGEWMSNPLLSRPKRPSKEQTAMKTNGKITYNIMFGSQWWCAISRAYRQPGLMKAAHVMPYSIKGEAIKIFLGEENLDFIFHWKNCIFLTGILEERWDKGWFVIVPDRHSYRARVKNPSLPLEYRFVLLHQAVKDKRIYHEPASYPGPNPPTPNPTWAELDKKQLLWKSHQRPATRYMYARFVMGLVAAVRSGFIAPHETSFLDINTLWATPGPYLRHSMIQHMPSMLRRN
ncbi:MAG: hypothetical protein M1831_002130 [Alyxoria varia]|nr:MAG: hypothetical protein M1831_002130 [Alyxoria varia]